MESPNSCVLVKRPVRLKRLELDGLAVKLVIQTPVVPAPLLKEQQRVLSMSMFRGEHFSK